MKNPISLLKTPIFCSFFALFTILLFQPTTISAQKMTPAAIANCAKKVIAYVDGYVYFPCAIRSDGTEVCTIKRELCECATSHFRGAKGCVDGNGTKYNLSTKNGKVEVNTVNAITLSPDSPNNSNTNTSTPHSANSGTSSATSNQLAPTISPEELFFQLNYLDGQTNCRLSSTGNKYITLVKQGHNEILKYTADGDSPRARLDFKAVEPGNHLAGFYIMTREATPRALMADGNKLSLRSLTTMDGMMKEMAKWRFFVNGLDNNGNTKYVLLPLNGPGNLVLSGNPSTEAISLVKKNNSAAVSLTANSSDGILPEQTQHPINWTCECMF